MKILSLGVGTQSTVIYFMSSLEILPRLDYAIFADPGSESKDTYTYLRWLINWQKNNNGIPIIWTGKKSIYSDLIRGTNSKNKRFASIPLFTKNEDGTIGMLRRQCTDEYKIQEVNKTVRRLYDLKPRKKTPKTEIWQGITIDELERLKQPLNNWQTNVYPLAGYSSTSKTINSLEFEKLSKADCIKWFSNFNLPAPPKSACTFCPYQSDSRWLNMKQKKPNEWKRAVRLDYALRNSTTKGVKQPAYLHRSCVPLDQVIFLNENGDLFSTECSGGCGV